jgi:hypothetical protein
LSNKSGRTGFIIPKAFTYASNWKKIRNIILPDIEIVADCGKVWSDVKLEMSICINQKNNKTVSFAYYKRNDEVIAKFGSKKRSLCVEFDLILNGVNKQETEIGLKLKRNNKTLNDFVSNQRGGMFQNGISESGNTNVLGGKQIGRYSISNNIKGKIDRKHIESDDKSFIKPNSVLVQRIIAHVTSPYSHIIITACCSELLGKINDYAILDTINQLHNNSNISSKFIVSIINSKLVSWYAYRFIFANAIRTMQFDNPTTSKIPFPAIDLTNHADKVAHDNLVALVDQMLALKKREQAETVPQTKTLIGRQIAAVDGQIDKAVYKLYGLTEEEIKVVEGGV